MKLKNRINMMFFLIIAAAGAMTGLSLFLVYNNFSGFEGDYNFLAGRLNIYIYALMIVSALMVISGILIFRGLMKRILVFKDDIERFTQNMIQGKQDVKLNVRGSDELKMLSTDLNRMADSYKEKISVLENAMRKRQKASRELQILSELTSLVMSEPDINEILKDFANRTGDLIESDYCSIIIFKPPSLTPKLFVTKDGVQDSSRIHIDPDGLFKNLLKDFTPLRLFSKGLNGAVSTEENISIPGLNLPVKDILAIPLIFSEKLTGILILANKVRGTFDHDDEETLMSFTFQAFQTIAMHDEITNLAITDGLTGLYNHRNFQETLIKAVDHANRYETNLSLLIMDIDQFKTFNEIYGHQVGDVVLKSIASIITEEGRKTDFSARYGGEEFAVIMPETNYDGARVVAERLRTKIHGNPFILPDGDTALINVSIGFASMPENTQDKKQLLEMADKALHSAKEHGGNLSLGISDYAREKDAHTAESSESALYTFEKLPDLIDSKMPYMKGHSQEVSRLSVMLAQQVGMKEREIENIRIAGILHDVGTINIPSKVLNKPGELTEEEKKIIKTHPSLAEMILKNHPKIYEISPIILHHHERFDGRGYPIGISGEDVPLHARILAIAEAFHAMISPRPYRKKLSFEDACKELQKNAGSQFDPHLVEVFLKTLKVKN